ncbi:MAG: hypothetical protein SOW25_08355 [Helicobacter sp.]|nr:hypothetical protein [Helicobacteraceae bacterium]MDY3114316.1 hypothetical protein [Helicobacter sp.]
MEIFNAVIAREQSDRSNLQFFLCKALDCHETLRVSRNDKVENVDEAKRNPARQF